MEKSSSDGTACLTRVKWKSVILVAVHVIVLLFTIFDHDFTTTAEAAPGALS